MAADPNSVLEPSLLEPSGMDSMMGEEAEQRHPSDVGGDAPQKVTHSAGAGEPAASPEPGPALNWLFVDLNSYFASVEQEVRPDLRGRPVAVVPMMADTTVCIAASYEAKAYGVKTGTMVGEAKRMCPDLFLTEARLEIR